MIRPSMSMTHVYQTTTMARRVLYHVVESIVRHEPDTTGTEKFCVPGFGIADELAEQLQRDFLLTVLFQVVFLQQLIILDLNSNVKQWISKD
jgi:hypothetical protein